jgi:hypothetical protein
MGISTMSPLGWVGPRVSLNDVDKVRVYVPALPGTKPGPSALSHYTDQ